MNQKMNLFLALCTLLCVSTCSAQPGAKASHSATLQPWLVGLSAVVGFLCIVFIILIAHRLLKKRSKDDDYIQQTDDLHDGHYKQTNF
ncbi:small integral membrane protein 24-like [Synchiropus splendidus]|uniref:small integral membrane protein 24-like n=1 Tax=Synchiropus splendidus TaxID=270530 RepID=UPI00237E5C1E|nr:small integral membrane protein 24-like [Synchiropus splendidus]